eukprot:5213668-Lingulodinium_polyedra.AAC.1
MLSQRPARALSHEEERVMAVWRASTRCALKRVRSSSVRAPRQRARLHGERLSAKGGPLQQ